MKEAIAVIRAFSERPIPILENFVGSQNYVVLDLSTSNQEISEIDI